MRTLSFLIPIHLTLMLSALWASESLEKAISSIDKSRSVYERDVKRISNEIVKRLDRFEANARAQGNQNLVDAIYESRKKFTKNGTLPDVLQPDDLRIDLNIAFEKCLSAYEKQIAIATKRKDDQLAKQISDMKSKFETDFDREHKDVRLLRIKWMHSIGAFEKINRQQWVEHTDHGRLDFVESSRDPSAVVLWDENRKCTVKLTSNECWVKFGDKQFKRFYIGKWEK